MGVLCSIGVILGLVKKVYVKRNHLPVACGRWVGGCESRQVGRDPDDTALQCPVLDHHRDQRWSLPCTIARHVAQRLRMTTACAYPGCSLSLANMGASDTGCAIVSCVQQRHMHANYDAKAFTLLAGGGVGLPRMCWKYGFT